MKYWQLLGVFLPACMFSPENNSQVCGANAAVSFFGYVPEAGASVQLQVASQPGGPWTHFDTVIAGNNGYSYAGSVYYPFQKNVVVPQWVSEGTTVRTYLRARYGNSSYPVYLSTYDKPAPGGQSGLSCINGQIAAGQNISAAVGYCDSSASPVVTITAPAWSTCPCNQTVVNGDVVINSAVSAAQYVCTQQINGNLTVTEAAPQYVYLNNLVQVTGAVDLNYSFLITQGPSYYVRRFIEATSLTTIGGDATLVARRDQDNKTVPQGLHAVTSVGGDITLSLRDANPNVFNGLTSHTGNISIQGFEGGNLDIGASGSFTNLTTVNGNLLVRWFYNSTGFFPAVTTVNGDVTIGDVRLYPSASFAALTQVTGDLVFDKTKLVGPWSLPVTVGGNYIIKQLNITQISNTYPAQITSAQGLQLLNNGSLTTLAGATFPLGSGDITITGNILLPQCRVDAFLAAQTAAGWTGAATVSGTALGPCP